MIYPLKLTPGNTSVIPPTIDFGVVLRKEAHAAAPAVATVAAELASCEKPLLGAGADNWADATEIPYGEMTDVRSEYTYNKDFTEEVDEPEAYKTAWWKLLVPAGKVAFVSVDTRESFSAEGGNEPDTKLAFFSMPAAGVGIADLAREDGNDDVSDYFGNDNAYWSRYDTIPLPGGGYWLGAERDTWFYIHVGVYSDSTPLACYVINVSISERHPHDIPPDGHDPNE